MTDLESLLAEAEQLGKAWADKTLLELSRIWGDPARLYTPRGIEHLARALQQYGDERAREARQEGIQIGLNGADLAVALAEGEARAAAIEEAATVADGFECGVCGMDGKAGKAIRALAAKPGATDAPTSGACE